MRLDFLGKLYSTTVFLLGGNTQKAITKQSNNRYTKSIYTKIRLANKKYYFKEKINKQRVFI